MEHRYEEMDSEKLLEVAHPDSLIGDGRSYDPTHCKNTLKSGVGVQSGNKTFEQNQMIQRMQPQKRQVRINPIPSGF